MKREEETRRAISALALFISLRTSSILNKTTHLRLFFILGRAQLRILWNLKNLKCLNSLALQQKEDNNSSSPVLYFIAPSSSQGVTYGRNNSQNLSQGEGNIRAAIGSSPLNFPSSSQKTKIPMFSNLKADRTEFVLLRSASGRSRYHSDLRSDRALPTSSSSFRP
ncbi:ATV_HP_G0009090.mRNA.1.CDS.1 [Saccharomyces cerevisiae]|nr:ATV_HP_G0009090.mRNA.1.CDS.1 [Saccharomyces cerevisiae]CAI6942387.1 ATV_HP_G0009090.mRNA.1.CDS.1 [Saccharomyces cerevisiae]